MHIVRDALNVNNLIATQPGARVLLCKSLQTTINSSKVELSNSSSSSSLTELVSNNQTSFSTSFINSFEEAVNFTSEIISVETDAQRANLPTYLVSNVCFNKSNQYAYLVTMNGDVFFFKMTIGGVTIKAPIWHRSVNAIVMKCYKIDINVIIISMPKQFSKSNKFVHILE